MPHQRHAFYVNIYIILYTDHRLGLSASGSFTPPQISSVNVISLFFHKPPITHAKSAVKKATILEQTGVTTAYGRSPSPTSSRNKSRRRPLLISTSTCDSPSVAASYFIQFLPKLPFIIEVALGIQLDTCCLIQIELLGMLGFSVVRWYAILLIARLRGTELNHRWMRLVKPDVVF
ncbi:unnamed protein product [Lactuca virosa]|uniref:Uncharacterized protein n=1 Tax=Lactuca virosa TaxID=75947 RepID=A0AAU9P4K9_9ASTR|nr:unnamed protein product [Lactuca virosa]